MYPFEGGGGRRQSQPFPLFFNFCAATKTGHLGQKPANPKTRVGTLGLPIYQKHLSKNPHSAGNSSQTVPVASKEQNSKIGPSRRRNLPARMAGVPNENGASTQIHFMISAQIRHQIIIWYSPHAPSTGGGNAGPEASKGSTLCY